MKATNARANSKMIWITSQSKSNDSRESVIRARSRHDGSNGLVGTQLVEKLSVGELSGKIAWVWFVPSISGM